MEGKESKIVPFYKQIADMGSGLIIAQVQLESLREQDINARIMKNEMQQQLTDNIKKRGQLESLPLCALVDNKIEIISGHHRIRSAKDSGIIKEIYVILDISGLRRSQIAAKQLAHNAIAGFDDNSMLKEVAKLITDVDDMIESYIGQDVLGEMESVLNKVLTPAVNFDWHNITFAFLQHQVDDFEKLIEALAVTKSDIVGVADYEMVDKFVEVLAKHQQFANVKNVGAAIYSMIRATENILDNVSFDDEQEYVQLTSIFGGSAIPKEAALVIKEAIGKMEHDGVITSRNKWQSIEYWAADYLAQ